MQFNVVGDVSIHQLTEESGYGKAPSELKAGSVTAYLLEHPELIAAGLAYSEEKRTSSGVRTSGPPLDAECERDQEWQA